jgi:hypothetical protein
MSKQCPVKIYRTGTYAGGKLDAPVYVIQDGNLYRTVDHELGWSESPDYELRSDGLIFRTIHHALGTSDRPDYQLNEMGYLYRTENHPKGASMLPVYELRD